MRCLVTGGTGYIGSYVVRDLLRAGKEVCCLQRSGVTPVFREVVGEDNIGNVKVIKGDQSDTLQVFDIIRGEGIEQIVCIGFTMPPISEEQPARALRVNSVGFNNILEAARIFGVKRIVWTSSTNALGSVASSYKETMGDDDAIYRPTIMYGATKVMNEFMARHYFQKFGVDSIGFRLPFVYGVGRYHGVFGPIMDFFRKAALNIPVTMGNAEASMGYLYIEDASDIIVKACDVSTTKTRVFNIEEGWYTWRQVVEVVRKINPQAQVTIESVSSQIHTPTQPHVNTMGIRTEMGWQPKYRLEDGVRRVLNYFRKQDGMPMV